MEERASFEVVSFIRVHVLCHAVQEKSIGELAHFHFHISTFANTTHDFPKGASPPPPAVSVLVH